MKRLLCALGFHRSVQMAKLVLIMAPPFTSRLPRRFRPPRVMGRVQWREYGVERCAWCGAGIEDELGPITTTSWRTLA